MKFNSFREFRLVGNATIADIIAYLRGDMADSMRNLSVGMSRLTLNENFKSFEVEVSDLASGSELRITNLLREGGSKVVPRSFIIVYNKKNGHYAVNDPLDPSNQDTAWDENYVYLRNSHPTQSASFRVAFLA